MFRAAKWFVLMGLMEVLLGCSTPNPNVRVRRLPNGRLEVDGPLAGPFETTEKLAAASCEIMMAQPGATNGAHGFEYCALYYYSGAANGFFLSYLSDIGGTAENGKKYCELPRTVNDPTHPDLLILSGGHGHPHNRQFSRQDMMADNQWRPTRILDKQTGKVFDRSLLLFYRERTGECMSYIYNSTSRLVSSLREGQWVPIGQVYTEDGDIRMLEGKDWLP